MKTGTLTLNTLNENDLKQWVQAFQSVAFRDKSATLARTSMMEEDNDLYCTSYSDGIFTVKLLPGDIPNLHCNLEPKTYILHLTTTEIQLKHFDDSSTIVVKWPYRYIRKYGFRDGKFTFEAGRKCDTGEGVFSLHHSNPQEVFRCMGAKMKSMKKLINGENVGTLDCGEHQLNAALSMEAGSRSPLPPSPIHHQMQTDNDQSGHLIRGFLSSNDSLNNMSMSSTSSGAVLPMKIIPNKPPRKSLPNLDVIEKNIPPPPPSSTKPPPPTKYNKFLDYEPVSMAQTGLPEKPTTILLKAAPPPPNKTSSNATTPINDQPPQLPIRNESMNLDDRNYEKIENISNAWKTLGVNDVKHTEHCNESDDDLNEFAWQRSQSQKDITDDLKRNKKSTPTSNTYCDADETLTNRNKDDDNYDKLEFFATKTKKSSDYRTIVTINSPSYKKQTSQPVTSDDYEVIGECGSTMSSEHKPYRLADDSYMGYGVLRKPNSTSSVSPKTILKAAPPIPQQSHSKNLTTNNDDAINHRKYNGFEYTIVSKPKHV